MSDLARRAAAAAGRTPTEIDLTGLTTTDAEQIRLQAAASWEAAELAATVPPADPIDMGPSPDDYDQVPVHVAWMRVMREVREIRKEGRFVGGGASYSFRGVDAAMNVFGAAQRKHGVIVLPTSSTVKHRDITTTKGASMRECTVEMTYRIYGPQGDHLDAAASGESLDSGDKGTAKAQSVALRVLLLQAGMVPTENRDPDLDNYERGVQGPTPQQYADEAIDPGTSKARLRTIYGEVARAGGLGVEVMDADLRPVTLGELIKSAGTTRQ